MTCVAGLVHEGKVYVGADSAGVGGYDLTVRADAKVFRTGPFLFGMSGSFRVGQLLRYAFKSPDHDPRDTADYYLVTAFINAVRDCLKDGGAAECDRDAEWHRAPFLLGYRGGLYVVDSDYQVAKPADPFAAVGCGANAALGSLYTSSDRDPKDRVFTALEAAERFSASVRGPFLVDSL